MLEEREVLFGERGKGGGREQAMEEKRRRWQHEDGMNRARFALTSGRKRHQADMAGRCIRVERFVPKGGRTEEGGEKNGAREEEGKRTSP